MGSVIRCFDDSWKELAYSVMESYTQRTGNSIISSQFDDYLLLLFFAFRNERKYAVMGLFAN